MIGFWWVSGMRESSPPPRWPLFPVAVESCDYGGARAAWALIPDFSRGVFEALDLRVIGLI